MGTFGKARRDTELFTTRTGLQGQVLEGRPQTGGRVPNAGPAPQGGAPRPPPSLSPVSPEPPRSQRVDRFANFVVAQGARGESVVADTPASRRLHTQLSEWKRDAKASQPHVPGVTTPAPASPASPASTASIAESSGARAPRFDGSMSIPKHLSLPPSVRPHE